MSSSSNVAISMCQKIFNLLLLITIIMNHNSKKRLRTRCALLEFISAGTKIKPGRQYRLIVISALISSNRAKRIYRLREFSGSAIFAFSIVDMLCSLDVLFTKIKVGFKFVPLFLTSPIKKYVYDISKSKCIFISI